MSEDNRNRARFAIYALAGVYLLYLAWQLFKGLDTAGSEKPIMIVAIVAFTLIGAAAVIAGVYVSGKQMKERYDAQLEYETKKAQQPGGAEETEAEEAMSSEETGGLEEDVHDGRTEEAVKK